MQKNTIPIHQIIGLVIFISAALITSLFVFHFKHKATVTALAHHQGILFPVPREINTFELASTTHKKFMLADFQHHWTLLFFGFTHCANICPTTLETMNRAYTHLHATYPLLQVVFISVDPERDALSSLEKYMHSFNPAFIGVTGNIQVLRKLQSQLGIYAATDNTTQASSYQIQHSASILLINPQGQWAGLFNAGLKPQELIQAFIESMDQLHA